MWRLSGVHRHVRLVSKPAGLAICDYACRTTAITENGGACLRIDVTLDGADALACSDMGYRVRASLHGPAQWRPDAPAPRQPEVWSAEAAPNAAGLRDVSAGEDELKLLAPGSASIRLDAKLPSARPWSAEAPWLYTLVVELLQARGDVGRPTWTPVDVESCRLGLRTVGISEGDGVFPSTSLHQPPSLFPSLCACRWASPRATACSDSTVCRCG